MNKRGKLDETVVANIKALIGTYSDCEIAKYFNLNKSVISKIRKGICYKYVEPSAGCDIKLKNKRSLSDYWVNVFRQYGKLLDITKVKKEVNVSESVYYSIRRGEIYKDVENISILTDDISHLFKEVKSKMKREGRFVTIPDIKVDERKAGVYIIRNNINNMVYVGSSINIINRLNWHYSALSSKKHYNTILQNSVNKYGLDVFDFIPIINCPPEYRFKLEQWFKDKSNFTTYFNIAKDCTSPSAGISLSDESKRKISERNKGHKWSPEQKRRLSKKLRDKLKNEEEKLRRLKNLGEKRFGEKSGTSKISDNQRLEVISKLNQGFKPVDIAKEYNISAGMISEVKAGRAWKHLTHLIKINKNEL